MNAPNLFFLFVISVVIFRKTLDFRGAIKILDDEEDLLGLCIDCE